MYMAERKRDHFVTDNLFSYKVFMSCEPNTCIIVLRTGAFDVMKDNIGDPNHHDNQETRVPSNDEEETCKKKKNSSVQDGINMLGKAHLRTTIFSKTFSNCCL